MSYWQNIEALTGEAGEDVGGGGGGGGERGTYSFSPLK